MTDTSERELLELAAKAAGVEFDGYDEQQKCLYKNHQTSYGPGKSFWDPLGWGADTLRLQAHLRIDISYSCEASAWVEASYWLPCKGMFNLRQDWNGDIEAATRTVIVRAAAAIGKETP